MNKKIKQPFLTFFFLFLALFFSRTGWAIQKAATLEPYIFHQDGDYTIDSANDSGSLRVSGAGARIGGVFGILFIGAEGMFGVSNMKTTLSPDTVNRDNHPLAKTSYDAIGGTLGLMLGRLQLYGTYFFDEKLNYKKRVNATETDVEHDLTYNYLGEGYKYTLAYNLAGGLNIGVGYHRGHLNRFRKKYEPETTNNKTTNFQPRSALKTETFEVYLSWRFATDKFVTIK